MKVHELKIWPQWFDAVRTGLKTYEIRKNDRNFKVGDMIVLNELRPHVGEYTGRKLERFISYVSEGEDAEACGLQPGFCVLGIVPTK